VARGRFSWEKPMLRPMSKLPTEPEGGRAVLNFVHDLRVSASLGV